MALATLIKQTREGKNKTALAMTWETKELGLWGTHDDVLLTWSL